MEVWHRCLAQCGEHCEKLSAQDCQSSPEFIDVFQVLEDQAKRDWNKLTSVFRESVEQYERLIEGNDMLGMNRKLGFWRRTDVFKFMMFFV